MVILSTKKEYRTPIMYDCDGPCNGTYVALYDRIQERTYKRQTFCPKCWKMLGLESDVTEEEVPMNQIY